MNTNIEIMVLDPDDFRQFSGKRRRTISVNPDHIPSVTKMIEEIPTINTSESSE